MHIAIVMHGQRNWHQVLPQAWPQGAAPAVNFELRAMRRAHDAVARGVQIFMRAPGHGRTVVRACVSPSMQLRSLAHDKQRVLACSLRIEPARFTVWQFADMTKAHGLNMDKSQFSLQRTPSAKWLVSMQAIDWPNTFRVNPSCALVRFQQAGSQRFCGCAARRSSCRAGRQASKVPMPTHLKFNSSLCPALA